MLHIEQEFNPELPAPDTEEITMPDPAVQALSDSVRVDDLLSELEDSHMGTPAEVLNLYFATAQAVIQLNAGPVVAELEEKFPWWADARNGHGPRITNWASTQEVDELIDRLEAFVRAGGLALQLWMQEHKLTEVNLWVFLPSVNGFGAFTVSSAVPTAVKGHRREF